METLDVLSPKKSTRNWMRAFLPSQQLQDTASMSDTKRMRFEERRDYNYFERKFRQKMLDESDLCELIEHQPFNEKSKLLFVLCLRSGVNLNCMRTNCISLLYHTAVKLRNEAWVECLLHFGADPTHAVKYYEDGFKISATDIAWTRKDLRIVWHFLRFDGPFPENFCPKELSALQEHQQIIEMKALVESRINLHRSIVENNIAFVEDFVTKHPRLKCAYGLNNQAALTTALRAKNFGIYALLRSFGYTHGLDSSHNEIISAFNEADKAILRKETEKYFKTTDLSVHGLMSISRLGVDNEIENFRRVQAFFEALARIAGFQPILRIVACSEKLRIVFDFNNSSICGLDPTRCNDNCVHGRAYEFSNEIFIGAKRESKYKTLGTLAHEMTHYALLMVFNNNFLPYHKHDIGLEVEMNEVYEACRQVKGNVHETLSNALSYKDQAKQHAELIVQVPQLMALYAEDPDALDGLKETYPKLFQFYDDFVMPALQREMPFIEPRQRMQEVNKLLGVYSTLKYQTYACDNHKMTSHDVNTSQHIYIQTNVPKMMMHNLLTQLNMSSAREANADHIFIRVEQLSNQKIFDTAMQLLKLLPQSRMFILEDTEIDREQVVLSLCQATQDLKVCFVTTRSDTEIQNLFGKYFEVKITWKDISAKTKLRLLRKKVILKCDENAISLESIIKDDSTALDQIPVEELIKPGDITLKKSRHLLPECPTAFVSRKFMFEGSEQILTEEKIKEILERVRVVVISDAAGMGKTVSAKSLANHFGDLSWCLPVYIDLKQHTDIFFKDDQKQPKISEQWFSKTLLKLDPVDQCIFEAFFETSRTLMIVDGFDEISPVYKSFVSAILTTIRESKNMLMVTTRPHLAKELETNLKTISMKSLPFNERDQDDYLEMYLLKNPTEREEREDKLLPLFSKIRKTFTKRGFLEVPLHMTMLAEVLDETHCDYEKLNVHKLYQKFLSKKLGIWKDKGSLASDDNSTIQLSQLNILQMHQKLALEYFFGVEVIEPLDLPTIEEPITTELISRVGLLLMAENGEILFAHLTFAEYLIAEFIFSGIISKTSLASKDTLQKLFLVILLEEKYEGVRKFVNDRLQTTSSVVEKFSKKFEESLKQLEHQKILYRMIIEEHTNLMEFVLKYLSLSKETRLRLINHKLTNQNQALHYSQDYPNSFKTLWSCIEDFTDINTQKKLLVAQGFTRRNVLNQSVINENALKFVLEKSLAIMTDREFMNCLSQRDQFQNTAIHRAALIKHFPAFEIIWSATVKKLKISDQKIVFFEIGEYDRTVLHQMTLCNDPKGLQFVLNVCKELCSPSNEENEEMRDFIFKGTSFGNTVLHMVRWSDFDVFSVIWTFVRENFNKNDQKLLMLLENKDGSNFLMKTLHSDFDETKKCVQQEAEYLLGSEGYQKALVAKYEENETMLHIVFEFASIDQVTNVLEELRLKHKHSKNALKNLILAKDSLNQHILNSLSFNKVHPVAEVAWNFVTEILEPKEVKMLLLAKAQNGYNAFITSVSNGNKLIVNILEWFQNNFDLEETKKVFQLRNRESRTLMHFMAKFCNSFVTQKIFDFALLALTKDEVQALLQEKDSNDMTIIDYALLNNRDSSTINIVWNTLKANLEQNDLERFRLEHERRLPASVSKKLFSSKVQEAEI